MGALPNPALWAIALAAFVSVHATFLDDGNSEQGPLLGAYFGRVALSASFDYVIVGGGTAGLTLANRLAANSSYNIPGEAAYFVGSDPTFVNALIDWEQYTTPQPGLGGRKALYASGKTLGGGSTRNFLFYNRGTVGSYQRWAEDIGDSSYTFSSLLPYFKRSVRFSPPNTSDRADNATIKYDASAYSSTGGPLQVSYPNYANPLSSYLKKALAQLGVPEIPGFSSGTLLGYQYIANSLNYLGQVRSSSETSFLRNAIGDNSHIALYVQTLAKKILFDDQNTATGVQVNSGGATFTITANREVILSAGTITKSSKFRSPQLLMVSGIGSQSILNQHGIKTLVERPGVGQNMWDHVLIGPSYEVNVPTHSGLGVPDTMARAMKLYLTNRTGILTNPSADFLGFEKLPEGALSQSTCAALDSTFPADWPDVELLFLDAYSGNQHDLIFGTPEDGKNYASAIIGLVAPFSRGNVSISSNDTAVNPVVNPNWLTDRRDQEVAIASFKRARQIFATSAMESVVKGSEAYPGMNITTDEEILDAIQQSASTIYHAAGTNKMGSINDRVDSRARVIGVKHLRVVDASIFPLLPPGHPQGTVYALAEKIADDVLYGSYSS